MQDRLEKLLKIKESIFIDKENMKGYFTKLNSARITANMKDEELESLDFRELLKGKEYIIIDVDASNEFHQKRFISIIKDRRYKSYYFKDYKVIVTSSDINTVSKEVLGELIIL